MRFFSVMINEHFALLMCEVSSFTQFILHSRMNCRKNIGCHPSHWLLCLTLVRCISQNNVFSCSAYTVWNRTTCNTTLSLDLCPNSSCDCGFGTLYERERKKKRKTHTCDLSKEVWRDTECSLAVGTRNRMTECVCLPRQRHPSSYVCAHFFSVEGCNSIFMLPLFHPFHFLQFSRVSCRSS